jgi:GntR family transcriptional regulator, rspAB operon transcriptional repressor
MSPARGDADDAAQTGGLTDVEETTARRWDTNRMPIVPALLLDRPTGANHTETAYYTIKRRIIELELPPGGQFTEAELAREWGMSKTPVREALARLQRDGLVESIPRAGYSVRPVTLRTTEALCEFRSIVEPKAAELAARRAVPEPALERLERLAESELAGSFKDERNSIDGYLRAHFEFQAIIANASGNDRLAGSIASVLDDLERVLRMVLTILHWSQSRVAERAAIVDALRRRDPEAAFSAMLARTQSSHSEILTALISTSSVSDASIVMPG